MNKTSVWNRYGMRISVNEQRPANEEQIETFKRFLELKINLGRWAAYAWTPFYYALTHLQSCSLLFQPSRWTFSSNIIFLVLFSNLCFQPIFQPSLPTFFSNFLYHHHRHCRCHRGQLVVIVVASVIVKLINVSSTSYSLSSSSSLTFPDMYEYYKRIL